MRSISLLVATLGLALLATACGSAAPSSTPTATPSATQQAPVASPLPRAPDATTLPTMDAARLKDWKIYVEVIYGCECAPPPAAGIIDVKAIFPQGEAANLTVISAEVDHRSMLEPAQVALTFDDSIGDECGLGNNGNLKGFRGEQKIFTVDGLPRLQPNMAVLPTTPLDVRLLVQDDVEHRYWVTVTPADICAAVS